MVAPAPAEDARVIHVRDLPTRLFYGLLAGAVAVALATGSGAPESWMSVLLAAGYLIVALLVLRLILDQSDPG